MPPRDRDPITIHAASQLYEASAALAQVALKQALEDQPERAAKLADTLEASAKGVAAKNPYQAELFRAVAAALRADIG